MNIEKAKYEEQNKVLNITDVGGSTIVCSIELTLDETWRWISWCVKILPLTVANIKSVGIKWTTVSK